MAGIGWNKVVMKIQDAYSHLCQHFFLLQYAVFMQYYLLNVFVPLTSTVHGRIRLEQSCYEKSRCVPEVRTVIRVNTFVLLGVSSFISLYLIMYD